MTWFKGFKDRWIHTGKRIAALEAELEDAQAEIEGLEASLEWETKER